MMWYVNIGRRHKAKSDRSFNMYLRQILITNAVFIAGYFAILMTLGDQNFAYGVLYTPLAFYVWTLLHLIATVRPSDYKAVARFSFVK